MRRILDLDLFSIFAVCVCVRVLGNMYFFCRPPPPVRALTIADKRRSEWKMRRLLYGFRREVFFLFKSRIDLCPKKKVKCLILSHLSIIPIRREDNKNKDTFERRIHLLLTSFTKN